MDNIIKQCKILNKILRSQLSVRILFVIYIIGAPAHDVMSVVERTRLWAEYKDKSKL